VGRRPAINGDGTFDKKRYRRVRRFFVRAALHIIWWDILLNRPCLQRFRTPHIPRWRALAIEFRALALELGGVLIKLGQFLGARVDLLPAEIIDELAGLQDEVPAVPTAEIRRLIEADFGRPLAEVFSEFADVPVGAASLAQVHKARLASGQPVAVKVLRPGIEQVVETDLRIIRRFLRRLKHYKTLTRSVDLDRLANEFVTVTGRELDMESEGLNAERFARDFAHDPGIKIPKIYWDFTADHVLTMEDVAYIRIDYTTAIEAAGISRREIAERIFDLYLDQISRTHFVHADPHQGNIFIRPLAAPGESPRPVLGPGDTAPYFPDRPFQLVLVDFGMAVPIPKRLQSALRDYLIGIGTQDARLIVESYLDGGVLLPDADLVEIERMTQALLERFSGSLLGQMKDVDMGEYASFYAEYAELFYNSRFQLQTDMLFVMRALGVLSGILTMVDSTFDAMGKVRPFTLRLMSEDYLPRPERLAQLGPRLLKLPGNLEDVLTRAQRGQLTLQTNLTPEAKHAFRALRNSIQRLVLAVLAVGLLLAGVIWHVAGLIMVQMAGGVGVRDYYGVALMAFGVLVGAFSWFSSMDD
jgi:predicted unusual protein kinase regulating ubiquinone biosynthesis (AarF/ABC1/UbiB family)